MTGTKKVMFVLPCMKGGGAERVAALLGNQLHEKGFDVSFVLTSSTVEETLRIDLSETIPIRFLAEMFENGPDRSRLAASFGQKLSSLLCKPLEALHISVPAGLASLSFRSHYYKEIAALRSHLIKNPETTVISFLQPSIPITVLATRDLPNRVIISERGNPKRLIKNRYGWNFMKRYYKRADCAVFQTEDAKNTYPECVSQKGRVIPNPIKSDLPEPYFGERNRNITTFCRISAQKNLPVLLEAFRRLHAEHPEYTLRIIGDALNEEGAAVKNELVKSIDAHGLEAAVRFEPFMANVHKAILHDAMYVNSSDFEGISNAMLEAMAIGMPVVCTDCPIGGAKATIRDGENGLLVPVGDSEAIYQAMKKIIEHPEFAEKMAAEAARLRSSLSLPSIADAWMQLL